MLTLSEQIRLNITIVVFAGPNISSFALEYIGNHIVDKSVLIPDALLLEIGFVMFVVKVLEDVLETTIVLLQDGVLRGEVQRIIALQRKLEARVCEACDGVVLVEHDDTNSGAGEVVNWKSEAIFALEVCLEGSFAGHEEVGTVVLISISVPSNDDGLLPGTNQPWYVLDDDRLSEHSTVEVVANCAVRALPHLLEVEFLDTGFVRSDGSALDTHLAFADSFCGLEGDLVVSLITVFNAQIEILDVEVEERMDKLVLDLLPDNTGHFIAVEFSHWISDLNLGKLAG
jgi:hypothetical protein